MGANDHPTAVPENFEKDSDVRLRELRDNLQALDMVESARVVRYGSTGLGPTVEFTVKSNVVLRPQVITVLAEYNATLTDGCLEGAGNGTFDASLRE